MILAFISKGKTSAVGATSGLTFAPATDLYGRPLQPGLQECLYTSEVNARSEFNIGRGKLEHSAEFNLTVQRMTPFWRRIMGFVR